MKKNIASFLTALTFIAVWLVASIANAQTTIIVESIPKNTPKNAKIYIAGNFNGWQPNALELQQNDDNQYVVKLSNVKMPLEFKFTRGSWKTVESNHQGEAITNRIASTKEVLKVTIDGWEDLFQKEKEKPQSTANANVIIVTDSFFMPQLNRYRRVWVYLPSNYQNSKKTYPVLYMHDGQNVFDQSTSYSGEWKVDETLLHLEKDKGLEIIVIAIDNGSNQRLNEYSPWTHRQYGGGEGDRYLKFLTQTLKPYIDEHYRTKTDAASTGIMGSSMGGLISMYGIMAHNDVFGKAGVFSPSFWFSKSAYQQVKSNARPETMKIYMLMGGQEGVNMNKGMQKMTQILKNKGFDDEHLAALTVAEGKHHESFWSSEFEKAVLWLFKM